MGECVLAGLGEWMGDGDEGWGMLMDGELRLGFGWRGGVSLSLSLSPTHSDVPVCWSALKFSHAGFIHRQKAAHLELSVQDSVQ